MKQHSIVMDDDHISASDEWAQDIVSNVALFLFLAWCFLLFTAWRWSFGKHSKQILKKTQAHQKERAPFAATTYYPTSLWISGR